MKIEKFEQCKTTLKQTSKDDRDKKNVQYMTEIKDMVYDYDEIKNQYIKNMKLSNTPYSNDTLLQRGKDWYFIEFKNGDIDNRINAEIKMKLYDSLLMLLDLLEETISFSRQHVNYILVYNENIVHKSTKFRNELNISEIQPSGFRNFFTSALNQKAKNKKALFDLERYKKLYFKEVYTVPKGQFDRFYQEQLQDMKQNSEISV